MLRMESGLSPRVRGSRLPARRRWRGSGSIPACAGEPRRRRLAPSGRGVYPRVCGGAERYRPGVDHRRGLSPRVRGSPGTPTETQPGVGSIPACAGEPRPRRPRWSPTWVYPRVCGGAAQRTRIGSRSDGLSPRVRGSPARAPGHGLGLGSIPACAGEPRWLEVKASRSGGLSPRVRGSPNLVQGFGQRDGSIPACAGEPTPVLPRHPRGRVYPRVCGGADIMTPVVLVEGGLSPRVRGSHLQLGGRRGNRGSIPACAGEP